MPGSGILQAMSGRVEAIFLAQRDEGERIAVEEAAARAGRGLDGDSFHADEGNRDRSGSGRDITLSEAEAIEGLAADTGIELAWHEPGRNVVTRDVGLNDLVGRRFRVGEVECLGRRLCDPCRHLEGRTQPGVLRGLAGRGGLRADLVTDGVIRVGDEISEV